MTIQSKEYPSLIRTKPPRKVRLYPVLPFLPRADRFRWDKVSESYTASPITMLQQIHWRSVNSLGNVTVLNSDVNINVGGLNAAKTFQRNKDWRQLVAKGQNATYPYGRVDGFVKPVTYSGTSDSVGAVPSSRTTFWGQYAGPVCVLQKDNTSLKDLALVRLKRKLNGYVGQAQLAAPLAESREIHRLVKQINSFGMDAVKALLLLKKTKGKSVLKLASQIWLGFGFGINPMLKDIKSAADAILDFQERQDRRVRVSGTANWDYSSSGLASPPVNIATNVVSQITGQAHHKQGVRIVAGIDLTIRSNASYSVIDQLGLGITSMPSAIWELVPFSWVVDYFTTVGPWLDDVFYTLPGTCKYVSQTTKYQNDVIWNLKTFTNPNVNFSVDAKAGGFRYFDIQRTSLSTLPTRQLRVKSLDEVALFGLTKFLNLSSVLAGHISTPHI